MTKNHKCKICNKNCYGIYCHKHCGISLRGKKCHLYKHGETLKKHYCKCGKIIEYRTKQCQTCWGKSIRKDKAHCIDCNKLVSRRDVTRCNRCFHKWNRGINHPLYGKIGPLNANYGKKYPGINSGKKNGMYGKPTPHGKHIKYNHIYFRSSYEVAYAKWLTEQSILWQYEPKTFDLGTTTYTPDFYLPIRDIYIEVKGYWREDALKKFQLFQKLHSNIRINIVDKKLLQKLGIIK